MTQLHANVTRRNGLVSNVVTWRGSLCKSSTGRK